MVGNSIIYWSSLVKLEFNFCFNKNKESGVNVTQNGDKTIVEAVV